MLPKASPRSNLMLKAGLFVVPLLLAGLTFIAGRALSIDRILQVTSVADDMRVRAFATLTQITTDFLPWGTGFGTFDPIYRSYELDELLHPRYFNHAHNDLLELAMTGGVPALLILLGFLSWFGYRIFAVVRSNRDKSAKRLAYASIAIVAMILAASLTDYPLRTGLLAMTLTLACCWLGSSLKGSQAELAKEDDRKEPLSLGIGRQATIAVTALFVAWNGYALTYSHLLARTDPAAAMRYWASATVMGAQAAKLMENVPAAQKNAPEARRLAVKALKRSPVNAIAARALAFSSLAGNDLASARREFAYAESISRRDLPTQIWLIEENVARDDIPGALRHYNRALLTSQPMRTTLIPVLATAADEPAVMQSLLLLLSKRPEWWSGFVDQFFGQSSSPEALMNVVSTLKLRLSDPFERQRLEAAFKRMIEIGAHRQALAGYATLSGASNAAGVLDGGFESEEGLPPFTWELSNDPNHNGSRIRVPNGEGEFVLALNGTQSGEAARQLIGLAPGRYQLRARVGDVSGGLTTAPFLSVTCATNPAQLATVDFPTSVEGRAITMDFAVPEGCQAQWLLIYGPGGGNTVTQAPWIDGISIAWAG